MKATTVILILAVLACTAQANFLVELGPKVQDFWTDVLNTYGIVYAWVYGTI